MKYRYGIFFVMCRTGLHESQSMPERSKIGWGQERQVVLLLEFLKITISTIDFFIQHNEAIHFQNYVEL
jgi:hypothetical protein